MRDIDSGMPLCILGVCQEKGMVCPDFCFFLSKGGVSSTSEGWVIWYKEGVYYEGTFDASTSKGVEEDQIFDQRVSRKKLIQYVETKLIFTI